MFHFGEQEFILNTQIFRLLMNVHYQVKKGKPAIQTQWVSSPSFNVFVHNFYVFPDGGQKSNNSIITSNSWLLLTQVTRMTILNEI